MHDDHFAAMIHGLETIGISRNQIAAHCGLSRATVWRLASGTGHEPLWRTIKSLETFYDSTVVTKKAVGEIR